MLPRYSLIYVAPPFGGCNGKFLFLKYLVELVESFLLIYYISMSRPKRQGRDPNDWRNKFSTSRVNDFIFDEINDHRGNIHNDHEREIDSDTIEVHYYINNIKLYMHFLCAAW